MKLKILTWNIAWAYGIGSDGSAYQPLPESHFDSSLEAMSELVRNLDIDVVLLQEVDFRSKRSHDLPELDILSRKSGLIYRAEEVSWDHPYVPFPGLLPSQQFGRIQSGGGILSRFPIRSVFSEALPKPKENLALYNWFYLSRYLQVVDIEGVRFCNLHLEAFSKDNRELHQVKLQNRLIDYGIDVAGGDFNGSIELSPELKLTYEAHPSPEPTFPSNAPVETLDGFILKKGRFKTTKLTTLNTGTVSDHFALLLEVESAGPLE
jgi:endonuclease/exonuclease/phosphatase family metal-dependent hydrolase